MFKTFKPGTAESPQLFSFVRWTWLPGLECSINPAVESGTSWDSGRAEEGSDQNLGGGRQRRLYSYSSAPRTPTGLEDTREELLALQVRDLSQISNSIPLAQSELVLYLVSYPGDTTQREIGPSLLDSCLR
ncbi:hypothetical protein RRG08_060943 [Elysia crispata]|uniref:Uncharacterized protein n=1 Tax=Elysia crispata TaxID=231223 RepID=A0AAE1AUP4_9GAST|nr:hypothetical protein RRG08_060943 [Elysia crispata]